MLESRLPWWLVLLLGVWVAGLAVWSWPRAKREIRWGAGLLSLVYLVLLFTALGGDPRAAQVSGVVPREATTASWAFVVSSAVAVLTAVFLLGRPTGRGQLGWFLALTVANAASCFVCGAAGVGWTLLAVSSVIGTVLARELRQGARPMWSEWLPSPQSASILQSNRREAPHPGPLTAKPGRGDRTVPIGLVWATGFALALLLVGTLRYTVRVETSRATASHRFSAIPSVDRVRSALETDAAPRSTAGPFELAFGRRADVIVLLAALAFLVLAMHNPSRSVPPTLLPDEPLPHGGTP